MCLSNIVEYYVPKLDSLGYSWMIVTVTSKGLRAVWGEMFSFFTRYMQTLSDTLRKASGFIVVLSLSNRIENRLTK